MKIALYRVLIDENVIAKGEGREMKDAKELTGIVDQIMKVAGRAGDDA